MKKILFFTLLLLVFINFNFTNGNFPIFIENLLKKDFPNSRIAQKSDFANFLIEFVLKYGNKEKNYFDTVIKIDLNNDSITDYALLIYNKEKRFFSFIIYISNHKKYILYKLSQSNWPPEYDGKIWQVMWLKLKGQKGISQEKYFNAPDKEYPYLKEHTKKDIQEYQESVLKYQNMVVIEKTNTTYGSFEEEDIFYCKSSFYYEKQQVKSVSKCD